MKITAVDIDKEELLLKKLTKLIKTFNKQNGTRVTMQMSDVKYWDKIDNKWYQATLIYTK